MSVARIGSLRSSPRLPVCWRVIRTALTGVAALPVERLFLGRPKRARAVERIDAPNGNPASTIERPGCEAADQTIIAHGHLQGLAQGLGGFGVLRTSKERLERAARAARRVDAPDIAATIDGVANRLPEVSTPEQAAAMAREIDPIIPKVWELGAKCGKALSPQELSRAGELAKEIAAGNITKDEATRTMLEETKGSSQ